MPAMGAEIAPPVGFSDERDEASLSESAEAADAAIESVAVPRLSPRPDKVQGVAQPLMSLNGTWNFYESAPPPESMPAEAAGARIEVPGEWVMQGFQIDPQKPAGYHRKVAIPADWQGRRIKLRCAAVYSLVEVYVNGQSVGGHEGGFTPFELDITEAARPGRDNDLYLKVQNDSMADILACGSKYAHHPLGGILRKIEMFALPQVNFSSLHVATAFDEDYENADLSVLLNLTNASGETADELFLALKLIGPDGEPVDLPQDEYLLPEARAGYTIQYRISVPVLSPRKWDAEHPHLYRLHCTLKRGEDMLQSSTRRFGFREIEVRGNQLFVNNKPVKLRGTGRHEVDPHRGRSLQAPQWREDARIFRDANINYVRTSHYPPAEEFIEACDELGIFVNEEAPFCWMGMVWGHPFWKKNSPHDEQYRELVVRQTLEMIERDRSHPSVIIWSLANESAWGPNFEYAAMAASDLDATRPLTFNYLPWEQRFERRDEPFCAIGADHYPGPDAPAKYADHTRPVLFDEYCHLNAYNVSEQLADPGISDYWGQTLRLMWEKMYASQGTLGGAIWAGIDTLFCVPGNPSPIRERWGIIDAWRRPKPEYWHVKKVYSPVQVLTRNPALPTAGEPIAIDIANRNDFTNINELAIEWTLGEQTGTVTADIPPRDKGQLLIPADPAKAPGQRLSLKISSPRGFVIDEYSLPIGPAALEQTRPAATQAGDMKLAQTGDMLNIRGENFALNKKFSWVIDGRNGKIVSGTIDGRRVVVGGPTLMILPLMPWENPPVPSDQPLNFTCSDWQAIKVDTDISNDLVEIKVRGRYKEADCTYTLAVDDIGRLTLQYTLTSKEPVNPRQVGMVFDVDRTCQTLAWKRDALWTAYPPGHIGRAEGKAVPLRPESMGRADVCQKPPWPWELDESPFGAGTNDFRATRNHIHWATLRSGEGAGLLVRSDGSQHARCWLDGERIRLLVAEFSEGSHEYYINRHGGHYKDIQRPLAVGAQIEDVIRLELIAPGQ